MNMGRFGPMFFFFFFICCMIQKYGPSLNYFLFDCYFVVVLCMQFLNCLLAIFIMFLEICKIKSCAIAHFCVAVNRNRHAKCWMHRSLAAVPNRDQVVFYRMICYGYCIHSLCDYVCFAFVLALITACFGLIICICYWFSLIHRGATGDSLSSK